METSRKWRFSCAVLLGLALLATALQSLQAEDELEAPSQCKPYIEKALKEQQRDESPDAVSDHFAPDEEDETAESVETDQQEENEDAGIPEVYVESKEDTDEVQSDAPIEDEESESLHSVETEEENEETEENIDDKLDSVENNEDADQENIVEEIGSERSSEANDGAETAETDDTAESQETEYGKESTESVEEKSASVETQEDLAAESTEAETNAAAKEADATDEAISEEATDTNAESTENIAESEDNASKSIEEAGAEVTESPENESVETQESKSQEMKTEETYGDNEVILEQISEMDVNDAKESTEDVVEGGSDNEESKEAVPEEDLIQEAEIPENLRPREHIDQLLKLDEYHTQAEAALAKISELTLKELKKLYENAIKPLETLYKYRDLSNRHFGDSEIFSKPLVVFMGPWSGGKSTLINYLLDNEYNTTALRSGAEPSPAYFNLLMYGNEPEALDGTQLAADFTFAGLQKFGQGLEERLRGLKLPNKLLEKINIVEIPGILEVRKQVSRAFPFNDACQWFIDRADIIFLVYDPSKLDVGPETEAILDQLKGREHQTRIVLNKADQVHPEELMRVQSALIWNISPLMSSAQPPVMYTTSLWSRPYESWAPVRLLHAQERAFLRDLRSAVDKRIENKISSARRFAVRVRNHAKMVDCYLTTYYNHKSVFGNRKMVADQIINHPQDYHIYEGLSTLTNISRYDLPDPDVYRDFFRLNPLYDFQQLSATCTYFRGCPINRLDVAIAYDFPELVGKHKKLVEAALAEIKAENS